MFGLFWMGKPYLRAELHYTDLDIWGHSKSRNGNTCTVKILNIRTCMSEQTV